MEIQMRGNDQDIQGRDSWSYNAIKGYWDLVDSGQLLLVRPVPYLGIDDPLGVSTYDTSK